MNVLITAGPTREAIDAVRFISNRSTGRMGYALAESSANAGYEVTLISGPVSLDPIDGVNLLKVNTAAEMACEVRKLAKFADIIIMAAAVADYRPLKAIDGKLKKTDGNLILEFERTEDILASLGQENPNNACLVGFAAETSDLLKNASEKLHKKNIDWIIANDVSKADRGFGAENNAVTMLSRKGEKIDIPLQKKSILADKILAEIVNRGYSKRVSSTDSCCMIHDTR